MKTHLYKGRKMSGRGGFPSIWYVTYCGRDLADVTNYTKSPARFAARLLDGDHCAACERARVRELPASTPTTDEVL